MTIHLLRYYPATGLTDERKPLRVVEVTDEMKVGAVRKGIRDAIANHRGQAKVEFKTVVARRPQRTAVMVNLSDEGFNLASFADDCALVVVSNLQQRALEVWSGGE